MVERVVTVWTENNLNSLFDPKKVNSRLAEGRTVLVRGHLSEQSHRWSSVRFGYVGDSRIGWHSGAECLGTDTHWGVFCGHYRKAATSLPTFRSMAPDWMLSGMWGCRWIADFQSWAYRWLDEFQKPGTVTDLLSCRSLVTVGEAVIDSLIIQVGSYMSLIVVTCSQLGTMAKNIPSWINFFL